MGINMLWAFILICCVVVYDDDDGDDDNALDVHTDILSCCL